MIPARTDLRPLAPRSPAVAGHQNALDGLRAVAAGAVLVTHVGGLTGYVLTGTPASWVVSRGNIGVPIFFVLSGLLLYRPWAAAALAGPPAVRVTTYLRRRALRILPAYWAVVPVPAADPELRHPSVVARDRRARAGPGLEPGRGGVLLPGPATARSGPHLVRLPRAARR